MCVVLEEAGRRAGCGDFRTPAAPGREPEPGRVTLGLTEKSSQGRVRVSKRPRAGGGEGAGGGGLGAASSAIVGAAPLRRIAAGRRPPPRAHRVRRGAASGVPAPPPAARRASERGGRAPAPGRRADGLTGIRHCGRAGLAPAARGVRGTQGARSPGSLGRPLPRPKGGVFPGGGKMGHRKETCRSGQGKSPPGSRDLPVAPTPSVTRPRSLSATRGGHADPPAPPPAPGSAPPPPWRWRRGGEGPACQCRMMKLSP
ncbi:uncharacterized protein LOC116095765 [Mastomys coucha]|uniref:uncharacterized protein LOC116095765 n=1 Tax=Mastomys coucha TaxID=35658 RepID=UPI0012622454|nr:uncharacterized protein LOC116095765 [Mastomys coucha]